MDSTQDPSNIPALGPPTGVTPDFVNAPTTSPSLFAGFGVMLTIATLGFAARMFTKAYIMRKVQLEDYVLAIGWVFSVVLLSIMSSQGPIVGRHQWNVSEAQLEPSLQIVNHAEIFYALTMLFLKLSILLQLKRIFKGATRDLVYWLTISLILLVVSFYTATAITTIAQCIPRERIWNQNVPGICLNLDAAMVSSASFNLAIDILIFVLPICTIFKLKMAIERKLGICAVFGIGLLACISSCFRLYYNIEILTARDLTYTIASLGWPAELETMSATLVACAPVMPRLYRFIRGEKQQQPRSSSRQSLLPTYKKDTSGSSSDPNRGSCPSIGKLPGADEASDRSVRRHGQSQQLRREWLLPPGKDGRQLGSAAASVEVLSGEKRLAESEMPRGVGAPHIRRTVTIETFETKIVPSDEKL